MSIIYYLESSYYNNSMYIHTVELVRGSHIDLKIDTVSDLNDELLRFSSEVNYYIYTGHRGVSAKRIQVCFH